MFPARTVIDPREKRAMTTIRAAAVQMSPALYSREGTLDKVIQTIIDLGKQDVQFATFGEALVPYYPYFSFVRRPFEMGADHLKLMEEALTVPSAATRAIGEACKRAGLVGSVGINEREGGSLYNTQLLFDADGTLIQRRRKMTPTYHERMVWGQGDASGLRAVDSAAGRVGQLACWEHYSPLARYALIADGEQIHSAMYPGSFAGDTFSQQTEINIRQHALEAGCFVVCATGWLDADQQAQIVRETGCPLAPISSGCFTAIVSPQGELLGEPIRAGEGAVIADPNFALIDERKRSWTPVGTMAAQSCSVSRSIVPRPRMYRIELRDLSRVRPARALSCRDQLRMAASVCTQPLGVSSPARGSMEIEIQQTHRVLDGDVYTLVLELNPYTR